MWYRSPLLAAAFALLLLKLSGIAPNLSWWWPATFAIAWLLLAFVTLVYMAMEQIEKEKKL